MRKSILAGVALAAMAMPALAQESASADGAAPVQAAAIASVQTAAPVVATRGQTIVSVDGSRLGRVLRLAEGGSPQIIFEGRLVVVPVETLSLAQDRLVTSLTSLQVGAL